MGFRYYFMHFVSKKRFFTYATKAMIEEHFNTYKFMFSYHPYLGYYPTLNFSYDKGNAHNKANLFAHFIKIT